MGLTEDLFPVTCPHCDAAFTAPADVAGLPITCKSCGRGNHA